MYVHTVAVNLKLKVANGDIISFLTDKMKCVKNNLISDIASLKNVKYPVVGLMQTKVKYTTMNTSRCYVYFTDIFSIWILINSEIKSILKFNTVEIIFLKFNNIKNPYDLMHLCLLYHMWHGNILENFIPCHSSWELCNNSRIRET